MQKLDATKICVPEFLYFYIGASLHFIKYNITPIPYHVTDFSSFSKIIMTPDK